MPPEPITVSVNVAAELTGLSKWMIRKRVGDGDIESVYEGSRRLVVWESLQNYIRNLPTERQEPVA